MEAVELTDEQWAVLESLLPEPPKRTDGRGRPWGMVREVLGGVLWVLRRLMCKELDQQYRQMAQRSAKGTLIRWPQM